MTLVLIVQNSGRSRSDMAATLRAEGYEILEAENAEAGTRLARTAAPEAILLDPRLPNRSGYELYALLRRDKATNAIPVLFLPTQPRQGDPGAEEVVVGGLDVVTRVGVALRTRTVLETLRRSGAEVSVAALTDGLTGLPNRRALEAVAELELSRCTEEGEALAVILADLDGFARVNDAWGFAVGDHALQAFAGLLHNSVRAGDAVGRWEGASYLMVLPATRLDAAWHVAERVRTGIEVLGAAFAGMIGPEAAVADLRQGPQRLEAETEGELEGELDGEADADLDTGTELGLDPDAGAGKPDAEPGGTAVAVSASLGVSERNPSDSWEALLRRAQTALERAKRAGRNRTEVA